MFLGRLLGEMLFIANPSSYNGGSYTM